MTVLLLVFAAGCRGPSGDVGTGPGHRPGKASPGGVAIKPADLEGDVRLVYVRTWGAGKRVEIEITRDNAGESASATSVWRKSSLMPERKFDLDVDPALLRKVLERLHGEVLEQEQADDGKSPHCSIEVVSGDRSWRGGGVCASLSGSLASLIRHLDELLHPCYFTALHLLKAGEDAESRLNAKDVYFYYANGIEILDGAYRPVAGDHTGDLIDKAATSHREERYVDAVVLARNALAGRLHLYRSRQEHGLLPSGEESIGKP